MVQPQQNKHGKNKKGTEEQGGPRLNQHLLNANQR